MAKIKYWRESEKCYVDANGNRVEETLAKVSPDSDAVGKSTSSKGKKQPDSETEKDE